MLTGSYFNCLSVVALSLMFIFIISKVRNKQLFTNTFVDRVQTGVKANINVLRCK